MEILTRNDAFTISEINGKNLSRHIGSFILGLDDGPEYRRKLGILMQSIHPNDQETIRKFIRQSALEITSNLHGEFDMVRQYTRQVPLRLLASYFGTPGPNEEKMLEWNRNIFWDVFLDLKNNPRVRKNALVSSREINQYLSELIISRKREIQEGTEVEDNLLNRLILMQQSDTSSFNDAELTTHIAGMLMAAIETTSNACINVLLQFYARKAILREAQQAAINDDVEKIGKLAFEALRFQPMMPVLLRYAKSTETVGKKKRKIKIKGRHDQCLVPRIIPVVENMAAIVIADMVMQQKNRKK
jgi:cytochrome P450